MAKGFRGAKNKQAALVEKLEQAKRERRGNEAEPTLISLDMTSDIARAGTNQEQLQRGDDERAEFERLLAKNLPRPDTIKKAIPDPEFVKPAKKQVGNTGISGGGEGGGGNFKVKARETKRARKRSKKEGDISGDQDDNFTKQQSLNQGDKASRRDFEKLLQIDNVSSLRVLGPIKAAQLVPWVPPFLTSHLVIVADPRRKSTDLRATVQYLADTPYNLMAVTADDPSELLAWKKRVGIDDSKSRSNITLLVDSSTEWMRQYSCIDDTDRWSTHILVIDSDGIIQVHCAKVDPLQATQIVTSAVRKIDEELI